MNAPQAQFDVVVVGAGGAGLAAAAEAAAAGCKVVVLEKNDTPGGSTDWAVGTMTATRTRQQKRHGVEDDPEWHFEDLALHAGPLAARDNLALRRILVDRSTEALEWLESLGVVFIGPMPEPPHRVARMHNVVPNAKSLCHHLARHCRALGVEIRTSTAAVRFVQTRGRVTGVEARTPEGPVVFAARRAVVLATGDYSADREMKARYAREEVVDVEAVNPTATGEGHRMALALGAVVVNGDIVRGPIMRFVPPREPSLLTRLPPFRPLALAMAWAWETLPAWIQRPFLMSFLTTALGPSPKLFAEGAILINRAGDRFTDELRRPGAAVPGQPLCEAYIVFDEAIARRFEAWPNYVSTASGVSYAYLSDYRRSRPDIYHRASDLDSLARVIGVRGTTLIAAVERHNAGDRRGRPALGEGPWTALGPLRSYCVFADGGLKVTTELEVQRADGSVIPGLYAAGSAGQGGVLLEGHGHHLAWAFVSGRIAGRNAAAQPPAPA